MRDHSRCLCRKVCEELTHWKRPWCWKRLKEGGEGDDRGWDGWMASPTRWTWVCTSSRSWCWTGKPGVQQPMGSQRVGHAWATELNWAREKSWVFSRVLNFIVQKSSEKLIDPLICTHTQNERWRSQIQCFIFFSFVN